MTTEYRQGDGEVVILRKILDILNAGGGGGGGGGGSYTLPAASAGTRGGIKVGSRLSIAGDVLSADAAPVLSVDGLTGATVLNFPSRTTVHVEKNGNDSSGNGTFGRPYLTIAKALSVIATAADASASKQYVVKIGAGTYAENVEVDSWTHLQGESFTLGVSSIPVTFIDGLVSLTDNFTAGQAASFRGLVAANFSDESAASLNGNIGFYNFSSSGIFIFNAHGCAVLWSGGGTSGFTKFQNGDWKVFGVLCTDHQQLVNANFFCFGCRMENVDAQSSGGVYAFYSSIVPTYSAGAGSTSFFDADSYPYPGHLTKDPTAVISLLSRVEGLSYVPAVSGDWPGVTPTTGQEAFDALALSLSRITNDTGTVLALTAAHSLVTLNNASPVAVTLPALAATGIPRRRFQLKNLGAGIVTVTADGTEKVFTTSAVSSFNLATGDSVELVAGAGIWLLR